MLTPGDELFGHQIPEPLRRVVSQSEHWRESYYFGMHPREAPGDAIILTMGQYPVTQTLDSLEFGYIDAQRLVAHFSRPYGDDPQRSTVGPVSVEIVEPYRELRLRVDPAAAPVGLDVTCRARTAPYLLRRGTMALERETVWDQSHFLQSGTYDGTYTHGGVKRRIDNWWGQRDHSWGIRDHRRCPMWNWLAIQLPDGMFAIWCWELPNGARIYTDGCFAPADGSEPIPVIRFDHDLQWINGEGKPVDYGRDGDDVTGVAGHVDVTLEGGRVLEIDAEGRWAQRYGPLGGGLNEVEVRTTDGWVGTAIYELTGAHHHRYVPVARAEGLPPG
jgi:hypothetical protein